MAAPKLQPGLLGGLFIGILSALPIVNIANCCCLWVIVGGMLAAYVMQQNHPDPVTVGDGAIVGLLAGFVGAITHLLVSLPLQAYLGPMMSAWSESMMRSRGGQDMPPELRRILDEMSPMAIVVISGMIFGGISLVFATLGGMLGAVFFRKSPPVAPPPPVVPPPPPPPFAPREFPSSSSPSSSYEESHVRPTDEDPSV